MASISAVIPAHNRERLITETLDSILQQKRLPEEVLVVDDGSTDGTAEVVREWSRRHPNLSLVLVEQENGGPSAARNRGLMEASGQWVAFLDADDLWEPELLASLEATLGTAPEARIVFADGIQFGEGQSEGPLIGSGRAIPVGTKVRESPPLYRLDRPFRSLLPGNFLPMSAVLVDRSFALGMGGFDERFYMGQDREFLLRAALASPFLFLAKPLARTRMHSGNLTAAGNETQRKVYVVQMLDGLLKNAGEIGLIEEERQATAAELEKVASRLLTRASRQGTGTYLRAWRALAGLGYRPRLWAGLPRDLGRILRYSMPWPRRGKAAGPEGPGRKDPATP
ncbi:MAG: glycosyltransferase [Thiohalorhabdus sp.]|uniref:glycosyltransferase family 2 protein n=1 Tax=Thiohalorhabdus sp. TaxID=3094134 RepID=UPI0039811CB3